MGEWISVKEALPRVAHGHFLVVCQWSPDLSVQTSAGESWVSTHFWDGRRFRITDDYTVSHWMPMPEPPQQHFDPCPFCGNKFVKIRNYDSGSGGCWFFAECMSCEARGPSAGLTEQAAAGWNEPRGAL